MAYTFTKREEKLFATLEKALGECRKQIANEKDPAKKAELVAKLAALGKAGQK